MICPLCSRISIISSEWSLVHCESVTLMVLTLMTCNELQSSSQWVIPYSSTESVAYEKIVWPGWHVVEMRWGERPPKWAPFRFRISKALQHDPKHKLFSAQTWSWMCDESRLKPGKEVDVAVAEWLHELWLSSATLPHWGSRTAIRWDLSQCDRSWDFIHMRIHLLDYHKVKSMLTN